MNNAEKNFSFWRSLFDLPNDFPTLSSLTGKSLTSLMVIDPKVKNEILSSLTSNKFTIVSVNKGFGLSTLFEYMYSLAEIESFNKFIIPIRFDLLDYVDEKSPISERMIEEKIKLSIIDSLLSKSWEVQLRDIYYYDCINYNDDEDLNMYRLKLKKTYFENTKHDFEEVAKSIPFLTEPFDKFLNFLLDNFRMQIVVYYHIPEQLDVELLLNFISSIKCLYDSSDIKYAVLREIYFCTPQTKIDVNREYKRSFNIINYPIYNSTQVFTMLQSRYSPTIPGKMGREKQPLNSIFDEELVKMAWSKSSSLIEAINNVREIILNNLDCREQDIPFKLGFMKSKQKPSDNNETVSGNTEVKRRFKLKVRPDTAQEEIPTNQEEEIPASSNEPTTIIPDVKRRFKLKK